MATVVLVHGIWMTGIDMTLLRWRLRRAGYRTAQFSYPSVRQDCRQNAARLQQFVARIPDDEIHFVAHSLGGLLLQQYFMDYPEQKPGRVVTLATPHLGSSVAQQVSRHWWGRWMMGKSLQCGLLGEVTRWQNQRPLGVIAGSKAFGVGIFIAKLQRPHDGTVQVSETQIPGLTDHIVLPVTHVGMMFSSNVARQVNVFLATGAFNPAVADITSSQ